MTPTVNDKTTRPPGMLPANARVIVLAVIVVLVLITSFFSGHTSKKPGEAVPTPSAGPSQTQLSMFVRELEQQRKQVEEEKKQAEAMRLAEEQNRALAARFPTTAYGAPEPQRVVTAAPVDPFEQKRREREEAAPFASNIALRIVPPETAERSEKANKAAESAAEQVKPPEGSSERARAEARKNTGSGKYLPSGKDENGNYRLYEGTMFETKLVNRLDGSFTGPVKCEVSKDVRSQHGEAILIPVGSQFFGEARRVESTGQTRLAVSFRRLLLPNGYSVDLESVPGLNERGETGLKDQVNNHYLRTLGLSGAVGLLGGLALYGGRAASADYATGVANAEGGAATTIVNRSLNVLPTITIREGHEVKVYLTNDLQLPEYRPEDLQRKDLVR